jgi:glycosyltransferase involved in cell wall biosynthesis
MLAGSRGSPRSGSTLRAAEPRARGGLLYLSNGNLPSRWAHGVQIMKMSEQLAQLVPRFELAIAESLRDRLAPRLDLWSWYGIARPFPVARLPLWLWRRSPIFESVREARFSFAAPRYATRVQPALVWTRSVPIADACLARGLPVLFERHAVTPEKGRARVARIAAAPNLRGFITLSDALCRELAAEGIPSAKLGAFPSAASEALPRGDVGAARRALGIAERGALAVYVGRLSEDKGLPTLLAAAARLPDVRFVVLGGSDEEVAYWRARASANVSLRGFVANAQVPAWLAAADVGLFTNSARDPLASATSPLKLAEYAAAGLPIVASAIPAVTPMHRDGENAFLFAPDDANGLAAAISRALADPTLAAAVARRASDAAGTYTWRERCIRILTRFAPELLAGDARSAHPAKRDVS